MQEQEQCILEEESLKVLSLFPKREIANFTLNSQIYAKLYDNLTCTICREIFINPVYLKCSHRFCKECIQRYIRSNTRKSCPNCRGGLTTKRDLRSDYSLESFISYAFGDAKKLTRDLQEIDKLQIERNRTLQLKKIESMMEIRQRPIPDIYEDIPTNLPAVKRIKSNDGDQIRRKKRQKSEKRINSQKQTTPSVPKNVIRIDEPTQRPRQIFRIQNIKKQSRKKRKEPVVIQIQSNSNQLEKPPAPYHVQPVIHIQSSNKNQCSSINLIPEISEIESSRPFISSKQEIRENQQIEEKYLVKDIVGKRASEVSIDLEEKTIVNPEVESAKQLLAVQFGDNYLNSLIQLSLFAIYIKVELRRHPNYPFTPELEQPHFKLPVKSPLNTVSLILANSLNLNKEAIRLFVKNGEEDSSLMEVQLEIKIQQLNQKYWKMKSGYEIINLCEMMDENDEFSSQSYNKNKKTKSKRLLYYAIEYSKIVL